MRGNIVRGLVVAASLGLVSACGGGAAPAPSSGAESQPTGVPEPAVALVRALDAYLRPDADPQVLAADLGTAIARVHLQLGSGEPSREAIDSAMAQSVRTSGDARAWIEGIRRSAAYVSDPGLDRERAAAELARADSSRERSAGTPCSAPEGTGQAGEGLTVIYMNGIASPPVTYRNTLESLDGLVRSVLPGARVLGVHNRTAVDDAQAFAGLTLAMLDMQFPQTAEALRALGADRLVGGAVGGALDVAEAAEGYWRILLGGSAASGPTAGQARELANVIEHEVGSGRKVVLMPHSQGNLIGHQALQLVRADAGSGAFTFSVADLDASVGFVQLGSPVPVASGAPVRNTHRVSNCQDGVAQLGAPGGAGCLPSDIQLPWWRRMDPFYLWATFNDFHYVDTAYLTGSTWTHVAGVLGEMDVLLDNPLARTGQGALQVTLTWNGTSDVDLYVAEPTGGPVVYFGHQQGDVGRIDVDDTNGYGPENYFVCGASGLVDGTYRVSVNHYSGSAASVAFTVQIRALGTFDTIAKTAGPSDRGGVKVPVADIVVEAGHARIVRR